MHLELSRKFLTLRIFLQIEFDRNLGKSKTYSWKTNPFGSGTPRAKILLSGCGEVNDN